MAERAQPLGPAGWAGIVAAAAVPALVGVAAWAVWSAADTHGGFSPADWAAIRFTFCQAIISAALSVLLATPVARALARRRFRGRNLLITLLGAPFLLPVIVAIFGLLAIFGRGGIVNAVLTGLGMEPVSIYGLHGVVLAHVFFNLPLATRLLLQGWQDIPGERFRLAASLNMGPAAVFRHLEWPMLVRAAPPAFLLVFVLCTTSFAVALTLGGGPRATTVELAIYQAVRFEFDLTRAALLSLVQLAITGVAAALALRWAGTPGFGPGLSRAVRRWDAATPLARGLDTGAIGVASLFLLAPLAAVVLDGALHLPRLPEAVWLSALRSLAVALVSTLIVVSAAVTMALAAVRWTRGATWIEGAGLLAISASPLVLGTGLFLLVFPIANPATLALPVTALVNAVVTLPFALRSLIPAMKAAEEDHGRLANALGLSGWARMRLLALPRLARPLGFSAGVAAALSMGDLGVIALFADAETATLPLQIWRLMGAYRMDDAGGAVVLLLGLSFSLFWIFDAMGRRHA